MGLRDGNVCEYRGVLCYGYDLRSTCAYFLYLFFFFKRLESTFYVRFAMWWWLVVAVVAVLILGCRSTIFFGSLYTWTSYCLLLLFVGDRGDAMHRANNDKSE